MQQVQLAATVARRVYSGGAGLPWQVKSQPCSWHSPIASGGTRIATCLHLGQCEWDTLMLH